jgi:hypothetical protein
LYFHHLGKIFVHGYDGIDRIVVQVSSLAVAKSLLRTNFVVSFEKVDRQRIPLRMTKLDSTMYTAVIPPILS